MVVGLTQYAFPAKQQGRLLMSSAVTRMMNSGVLAIMCWNNCRKEQDHNFMACLTRYNQRTNFFKSSFMIAITLYVDQGIRINVGFMYI